MSFKPQYIKLSTLISEKPRNGLYKGKEYQGCGHRWVKMSQVYGGDLLLDQPTELLSVTESEIDRFGCEPGDLLFGRTSLTLDGIGDCLLVGQVDDTPIFESNLFRLRFDKEKAYPLFFFYFFKSKAGKRLIQTIAKQTAATSITASDLIGLPVPDYPLRAQKKIADQVFSYDKKIALNNQTNQTLEQIAQAIFKSWFVDFEPVKAKQQIRALGGSNEQTERAAQAVISGAVILDVITTATDLSTLDQQLNESLSEKLAHQTDAQREQLVTTASHFPDQLTKSELGPIPKGWLIQRIEELVERTSVGKKYSNKTAVGQGAIPILDQGKSGIIGYHNDEPGVEASTDNPIIVFANHTCYMRLMMHDFSAIQNVLPFRGKDRNIYWLYNATIGKQEFVEYKGHWPDFARIEIVVPENKLDEDYGQLVESFFVAIYSGETEGMNLGIIRDTLLPKLLSGEIEVQKAA